MPESENSKTAGLLGLHRKDTGKQVIIHDPFCKCRPRGTVKMLVYFPLTIRIPPDLQGISSQAAQHCTHLWLDSGKSDR